MKYVPLPILYVFLLMDINSKFLVNSELVEERGRNDLENGPDKTRVDRAIHESYRPRHKYKVGTGHEGFVKRFARSNTDGPQCAVMYKNNEPVGILQPYEESYRFLPVKGEPTLVDINPIPVKRKTIMDVLYPSEMDDDDSRKVSDTVGFADEKYPSVFAKFKIDSRLAKTWTPENYMKRSMFKREQSSRDQPLEPANPEINKADFAVENELKTILDDMGLIDDYPNRDVKRAIEDENLELGTNRINLFKEERTESREKRDDLNATELPTEIPSNTTVRFAKASASKISGESDIDVELNEGIAEENPQVNEVHDELAAEDTTADGNENEGNRSPYETRIERAIRDKIHKLKEEVKKEIDKLRGKSVENKEEKKDDKKDGKKDEKKDDKKDEKKDEKKKPFSDDTRRKKRQTINTLVEEENKDIDPITYNDDNEKVHIRRKRNTDFDDVKTSRSHWNDMKFKSRSLKKFDKLDVAMKDDVEYMNEQIDSSIAENDELSEESSKSDSYDDDESDSNNDSEQYFDEASKVVNDDTKTSDTYERDTCNCDKSNNECKCSIPSLINRQSSRHQDKSSLDSQEVSEDSSKEHCSCDKNGNCKCLNSLLDNHEAAFDEDYSADLNEEDEDQSEIGTIKRDTQDSSETKQHCSCNENSNCKCGNQVIEPLLDQDYSALDGTLPKDADDDLDKFKREDVAIERNKEQGDQAYGAEKNDDHETVASLFSRRAIEPRKEAIKNFRNGEYFVDFHPSRYRLSSGETLRRKRDNFGDMVAIHGGEPIRAHLAAIRERSMLPFPRQRAARRVQKEENNSEPRQLIDMSDEDIFGALPQGFDGGLQRYKRVKRT